MCGFVGILGPRFDGRAQVLRGMLKAIAHRGPDGEGVFEDEYLALGHRRLSIFDPSDAAAQPMVHPDTGQVLAFNGAIYNHVELRAGMDEAPRSSGDTEVLLRQLALHGEQALAGLNGMWAFAFWDPRRRELLLSRDRLGVKPLYWRRWGEHLAFASEPQALLGLEQGRPSMNADAFATFVLDRSIDHSQGTFFDGIGQLPPASVLRLSAGQPGWPVDPRIFWDPARAAAGVRDEDGLLELLDDSVRLRMRSDVSMGFLVSGGLDSSSVLALAARNRRGEDTRAYTLRYSGEADESALATDIVEHVNGMGGAVDLSYIEPGDQAPESALTDLIRVQGEPFSDGSMLAHFLLMRALAADGHKVVVGGLGGDEALAGYIGPYSRALASDRLLRGHPVEAARTVGGWGRPLLGCALHLPPPKLRNRLRRALQAALFRGWLRPGVMAHVHDRYRTEGEGARFRAYLIGGLRQWALPGFTHYEDRNAMHFGLEARAPFLDYRIIEWGLSCSPDQLVQGGLGKMALRRALSGLLPDSVLWRRDKQGLHAPAGAWLMASPGLVEEALVGNRSLEHWVDTRRLWADYRRARDGGRAVSPARMDILWRVVTAGLWMREFDVGS
ncbi:MAG: asparagine synthase (glutamine-hydrolyzing) [Gammaproteobacteria bacterium]